MAKQVQSYYGVHENSIFYYNDCTTAVYYSALIEISYDAVNILSTTA